MSRGGSAAEGVGHGTEGGPCTVRSNVQKGPMAATGDQGVCTVRSNASWVMVAWDLPVDRMMDRHD